MKINTSLKILPEAPAVKKKDSEMEKSIGFSDITSIQKHLFKLFWAFHEDGAESKEAPAPSKAEAEAKAVKAKKAAVKASTATGGPHGHHLPLAAPKAA